MPDEFSDMKSPPQFDLSKFPSDLPRPVRQPGDWASDEDGIVNALCEYLDTVAQRGRKQPAQHDYRAQQKGRRSEWPAASILGRVGPKSFTGWIERVIPEWEKRRKAKKAA